MRVPTLRTLAGLGFGILVQSAKNLGLVEWVRRLVALETLFLGQPLSPTFV